MSDAFVSSNELERLLVAAATDPASRPAFYRAVLEHDLFVISEEPLDESGADSSTSEVGKFKVRMIELQGTIQTPIFSSLERLSAVLPQQMRYVAMRGDAMLACLRGKDLMLNPGSDYGKHFTAPEVDSILDGSIFAPQATPNVGGKKILLGQPAEYPLHLTEPLARLFSRSKSVTAAYLAHSFIAETDDKPHTLIGLEIDGDWQRIVADAGVVVREVARRGEVVDFVQLQGSGPAPIAGYMREQTMPFYKRKRWLGLF